MFGSTAAGDEDLIGVSLRPVSRPW